MSVAHDCENSKDHHGARLRLRDFSLPPRDFGFVDVGLFLLEIEESFNLVQSQRWIGT